MGRRASLTVVVCCLVSLTGRLVTADLMHGHPPPGTGIAFGSQGQSLTTPISGDPAWYSITFNFYDNSADRYPHASSGLDLFLLSQEYLGYAGDLSGLTPGYIAHTNTIQSEGGGEEYVFATEVTLLPGSQYWFYMRGGSLGECRASGDTYAGGMRYWDAPAGYTQNPTTDLCFELEGVVPEPCSMILAALGAAAGLLIRRRRRKAA